MTLRERQKTSRREAMLTAARVLFKERTYAKTTMEAIADEAEVGIATLYNYFGTKERVLAEIAKEDLKWIRTQCDFVVEDPPTNPVRAVQLLFEPYEKNRKFAVAEMASVYLKGTKQGDGPLRDTALWADKMIKAQVTTILSKAKGEGRLSSDLPVDEAADIILILFNQFYYRAFGSERKQVVGDFKTFMDRVSLVFRNWYSSSYLHAEKPMPGNS